MRSLGVKTLLLVAVAVAAAGCASNTETVIPTPTLTTETFTGTLTTSGSAQYFFIARAGQVDVKLDTFSPGTTLKLTVEIGVYNTYYGLCNPVVTYDNVVEKMTVSGLATATTAICVVLWDTSNVIPSGVTENYTIKATHY